MEDVVDDRSAETALHQRVGARSNGRSPAKSSSTSEEEGQVEERERRVEQRPAITSTTSPARHASPREPIAQVSNALTRERSTPASWRQRTPVYSDRTNNHSWRQDVSESVYGRGRGLEGLDVEAGPSRRAMYRIEERGPHPDAYGRHRDSIQSHDRYNAATRSMSIGAFDERYHSPSASHYDDRERDWREDRAREREYQWDRVGRDTAYHRSQYARPSSPIRPSPTPHSRGLSGSWSGPTSPSSSWRDRWSSGTGAATADWDRERHERDRNRDHGGFWQSREGPEIGPDIYQRKLSNPSSPPPRREVRDHSRSRLAKAGYNHLLQSNSSPTPSTLRSPDLQRSISYEARRESDPTTARQWPEGVEPRPPLELAKTPPRPSLQPSSAAALDQELRENEQEGKAINTEEEEVAENTIKLELADEALPETETAASEPILAAIAEIDVPSLPLKEAFAVGEDQPASSSSSSSHTAQVQVEEARALEEVVELGNASKAAVATVEATQSQLVAMEDVIEPSKIDQDVELAGTGKELVTSLGPSAEPVKAEDELLLDVDMTATLPEKHSEATLANDDVDMEPDEQYDASGDVTIDSTVGIGDDSDHLYASRLRLDQEALRDFTDDPPLPTPRTREERDLLKRAGMYRLLQDHRPNLFEVKKVFADNKKILANPSLRPLESAIYGEYPRKNHTEPWLDESDEEIQQMRLKMTRMMRARHKRMNDKIASLKIRYKQLNKDWQRHCAQLYRQSEARESQNSRTLFGGTVTISGTSASLLSQGSGLGGNQAGGVNSGGPAEESTGSLMMGPSMTRANRRQTQTGFAGFGDAVRSEAEFLEILASLESADMQDPNMRAARTTATEPDMILNPDSKAALLDDYDDDNGFVADPLAFYFPTFDPDYWTEDEKATFDRRYALFPKQFGKIAASLPQKTAKQCVSYYYLTKHAGHDYKSLTAARNRDRKRKTRVKPRKGRGSALMADLKGDDMEEEDQQSPLEGSMAESGSLISARARPASASSRARILTSSTLSGDLGVVAEEEEDDSFDQTSGRKRRVDEMDSDEKKSRPGSKSKRPKSEKKSRASIVGAADEEVPGNLMYGDPDLAAAEALGALAGAASTEAAASGDTSFNRRKKSAKVTLSGNSPARIEGVDDGAKRSRQTTSSYWSVAERNEFLRSLATWGKDWDAIATTLSTKSAAQARNYYARNVEESEFVEAVAMARDNTSLDLAKRQALATAFVMQRASLMMEKGSQPMGAPHSGYFAPRVTSTPNGSTPTARGLNINSLLNEDVSSSQGAGRRASLTEWFGTKKDKDEDSNDETEDEDQEQAMEADEDQRQEREPSDYFDGRGRSSHYQGGYPSAGPPSRHLLDQVQRRSPSILSSMPPPSAFIGAGRYQLPGQPQRIPSGGQEGQRSPLASFHYNDSMTRTSTHSPSESHLSAQQYRQDRLNSYDRDATRSSWSPTVPSPNESMPVPHRHGSWPHAYTPSHLAPPQLNREDQSPSSLSPYPRPNTTHGTSSLSSYPFPHPTYERPHSSSGHTSAIRSLSPNPPTPRLPPLNQSLFTQRRDQRDSPH